MFDEIEDFKEDDLLYIEIIVIMVIFVLFDLSYVIVTIFILIEVRRMVVYELDYNLFVIN